MEASRHHRQGQSLHILLYILLYPNTSTTSVAYMTLRMSSSLMNAAPGVFCAPPPPLPVAPVPVLLAGAAAPGAAATGPGGGGIMPGGYWNAGGAGCDSGMNFTEMFKYRINF